MDICWGYNPLIPSPLILTKPSRDIHVFFATQNRLVKKDALKAWISLDLARRKSSVILRGQFHVAATAGRPVVVAPWAEGEKHPMYPGSTAEDWCLDPPPKKNNQPHLVFAWMSREGLDLTGNKYHLHYPNVYKPYMECLGISKFFNHTQKDTQRRPPQLQMGFCGPYKWPKINGFQWSYYTTHHPCYGICTCIWLMFGKSFGKPLWHFWVLTHQFSFGVTNAGFKLKCCFLLPGGLESQKKTR